MRSIVRVSIALVLGVALIAIPLLIVQRAECPRGQGFEDQWAVVLPGREGFDRDCRDPQSGGERLLEFVRGN